MIWFLCLVPPLLLFIYVMLLIGRANRRVKVLRMLNDRRHAELLGVGISAVALGVNSLERVFELASISYERFEVVLVCDSQRDQQVVRQALILYHMVEVEYPQVCGVRPLSVRHLYRSTVGVYRHIVLLDRECGSREDELDSALPILCFEYVLPLDYHVALSQSVVEALALELSLHPPGRVEFLCTKIGQPLEVYLRRKVMMCGGFVGDPRSEVHHSRRVTLYSSQLDCEYDQFAVDQCWRRIAKHLH